MAKTLTDEQEELIKQTDMGKNVLVDACIGSGKTTAIQVLCNVFSCRKKILYLTYNKLLKIDARSKIKNYNVTVTNYHGFAWQTLNRAGIKSGISDMIQTFNKIKPRIPHYDMLVLDEYQDIEQEIAEMLLYIKKCNPDIQIIAVGDMKQKIYDKTTLQVLPFMEKFLENYVVLHFTKCFRICSDFADKLGRIWQKKIVGVNENCQVEYMPLEKVTEFLSGQNPSDILCLGARTGSMSVVLNNLEREYSDIFNKSTVYASIRDEEGGSTAPNENVAIFTTYDSSKGLERPICVVFDYTEEYWNLRVDRPMVNYEIIRNIFCVAASRGKERIIFVQNPDKIKKDNEHPLSEKSLSTPPETSFDFEDVDISAMFDFKYKESIEECYNHLTIKKLDIPDKSIIEIKSSDEMIDLSPCIGIYQEAIFFNNYDIDKEIEYSVALHPDRPPLKYSLNSTLEEKVLYLTAYETYQDRYVTQVEKPFINDEQKDFICSRLGTLFSPDAMVQVNASMSVKPYQGTKNSRTLFYIDGKCDVLTKEYVYELKFVSELKHEHFLQCACYMVALGMEKGILWNIRNNEMFEITIPSETEFMKSVVKTVTKGRLKKCTILLNAKTRKERETEPITGIIYNNHS